MLPIPSRKKRRKDSLHKSSMLSGAFGLHMGYAFTLRQSPIANHFQKAGLEFNINGYCDGLVYVGITFTDDASSVVAPVFGLSVKHRSSWSVNLGVSQET